MDNDTIARVDFNEATWRLGLTSSAVELAALVGKDNPDAVVATRLGLRVDLATFAGAEVCLSLPTVNVVETGRI